MKKDKQLNIPKSGMKRNTSPSELNEGEYIFMLNGNSESIDGNKTILTNEASNILAVQFPDGYKVVGYKNHPTKPITYYFLTNPLTGYSSIGYVENNTSTVNFQADTEIECPDCEYYNTLAEPLENLTQTPYNTYVEYLNDLCNKSLNFSINHPIKHIEIKIDKLGTLIYWVDGYNPDRWMDTDNIDFYKFTGEIICGEDNRQEVCVNVEKMLQQPIYTIPVLTPEVLQIGGNLRKGTYSYMAAYCDLAGNEISEFYSITQPVRIFDENNRVLDQTELDSFTNFAVQLKVENLDTDYKYYKVIVVERVAVNQAESYFELGIYPTTDDTVLHTSTQTGTENLGGITKRISVDEIMAKKVRYEHSRGIETVNNMLVKYGMTGKKFPNLQPIANLIGGFLKWNSSVAKEDLYKDPIASANYLGYRREEIQPFGLRFFTKDGAEYPVLPLVARPAKTEELEILPDSDKNLQSVLTNGTDCTTTERNKRWQIYNTATVEGTCSDPASGGTQVEEEETSTCIVYDVALYEDGSFTIPSDDTVTDLKQYVNSNREDVVNPASDKYIPELVSYLTAEYPEDICSPNFSSECSDPVFESAYVEIEEVVNQVYTTTYNETADSYPTTLPAGMCQPYLQDSNGALVSDDTFETDYALTTVYKRAGYFQNENCVNAISVINITDTISQAPEGYYNNYYGAELVASLQQTGIAASETNANFYTDLHKGALWFKIDKAGRDKFIFEITQNSLCTTTDDIPSVDELRYTFYESCSSTTNLGGNIIDTAQGELIVLDATTFPDTFYVAIDAPIVATSNAKFRTAPPCGCYSIITKDLQITGNTVSFDSMSFQKVSTYSATCTYTLPEVNDCKPIPYQFGDFSYWESTDTYPDNEELYDSSKLVIETTDIITLSDSQQQQFRDFYTTSITGTVYNLKPETDLRCKPIRHPKFPSNIVSPFMGTASNLPFAEGLIFPLGIQLDNNVVNVFLDIAVKNKLLTQKQRDEIAGYEILKGDNSVQKSIVANAIGFDMYKYDEKGKEVLYPNYPLNDLGEDLLQLQNGIGIQHPTNGVSNYNFSTLSPDWSVTKPTLPTEIIISGYQMGNSRGYFASVDNHPRYVLLTRKAKDMAGILGAAEALLEALIAGAEILINTNMWQVGGTSTGGNFQSWGFQGTAIGIALGTILVNTTFKAGQYRIQWMETIENLGQPRNFASYYVCEGYSNKFLVNDINSELVRAISSAKYLKSGRYTFKDEKTGETIKINNRDREYSTFISVGQNYPIVYPSVYSSYDNNLLSQTDGSRTIISENGGVQGQEIIRRFAVPYLTLKNYIPNQFGTIDSIKWLTTSYKTFLNENTDCEIIYGGTVFICRDYQERKHPIFRTDDFGSGDMHPFNYTTYPNIGQTRFRIDFRTGAQDGDLGSFLFPGISSDFFLDNEKGGDTFYMSEESKFYLYYYGFASYLVESEINTNFRYGRRDIKDQYYPDIQGDMEEFTQQKNRRIKEPTTYFYNNVYSRPVTQTAYYIQPATYSKEVYDKINDSENGGIYSLQDNSQNDLTDPWLIFRPLNTFEFDKTAGKLISVEELNTQEILFRFENGELVVPIENLNKDLSAASVQLGNGNLVTRTSSKTFGGELGFAGTQHTDYLKTIYGNFSVDAKRGQIFIRNGQQINPISDFIGGKDSGLKNWLRQQLPFKILKQFPETDIDNKYKGIGISMGYDNRNDRFFMTKKDYKPKNLECLSLDPVLGFVDTCNSTSVPECPVGYSFNPDTNQCEKEVITNACPVGYTYNEATGKCETQGSENLVCPVGWTYDAELGLCSLGEDTVVAETCGTGCTIIPQPDGNAICVCPATAIDNLCGGCEIIGGIFGCPDGYTYDEATNTCKKIVQPCPAGEGRFFGGSFSTPNPSLYNDEITVPAITSSEFTEVRVLKRQTDGKVLVGGIFTEADGNTYNRLLRLKVDGTIDETFDIGSGFETALISGVQVADLDIYPDGKIIVVGSFQTFDGVSRRGIVRLTSTGGIDYSFNPGTGFDNLTFGIPVAVKIVENNKILVGVSRLSTYNGQPTKGLIKLLSNGDIDNTFAGGDRLEGTSPTTTNGGGAINAIAVDENGRYIVGGSFLTYSGVLSRRIIRLNQDGSIHTSFGAGFGFDDNETGINTIKMQGNKILAGGLRVDFYQGTAVKALVRLNSNGTLDNTFNNYKLVGGVGILDFDLSNENEILVGGSFNSYDTSATDYTVLLDYDGFVIPTALPVFSSLSRVASVLNTPECNLCEEDCTLSYNELGQLVCTCPAELLNAECECLDQIPPDYIDIFTPVDFDNTDFFEEASWTIAYKCDEQRWISNYSFLPDYYVSQNEYFQTGYNYGIDKEKLWSHLLLGNNSQQVFNGRIYPWIVEYVTKNQLTPNILQSVSFNLEARRYHNEEDYATKRNVGFDFVTVYNSTNNSGRLKLVPQRTLSDVSRYPQTNGNVQSILFTDQDNRKNFNYFFNRVINQDNNIPVWLWDNVMVTKTLNPRAVSFKGKKTLERLRGDYHIIRMENTSESRYKMFFSMSLEEQQFYQ